VGGEKSVSQAHKRECQKRGVGRFESQESRVKPKKSGPRGSGYEGKLQGDCG